MRDLLFALPGPRGRFASQTAPGDTPWVPLSPRYHKRKKRNRDRILVLDGLLLGTLRYQVVGDELRFGTDRVYGATH